MSYISKKGKEAAESATAEKVDVSKVLFTFKSGTSVKVRLASAEDYVEYYAATVYKVFNTTPVLPGSLYAKAADLLYKDAAAAKSTGNEADAKAIGDNAYLLKPKQRYLFGFINLEDGAPIVIDVSKKQATALIQAIEKYAKKIVKTAFELSKSGSSTNTTVTLAPILDMDEDLTEPERKNFADAEGKTFDDAIYGSVLKEKTPEEQAADLVAFGFDIGRLGLAIGAAQSDAKQTKVDDVTPLEETAPPANPPLNF